MLKRAHIFISGRVQGVFFRARTQEIAASHSLTGWVRNCCDGRVEAVLEGEDSQVDKVIEWCREGPPAASVKGVEIKLEEPAEEYSAFSIRY